MVLAHRERLGADAEPAHWSERRVREGAQRRRLPGARCLRPAQRGGHPGAAARRHPVRAVGLPRAAAPATRSPSPHRSSSSAEHDGRAARSRRATRPMSTWSTTSTCGHAVRRSVAATVLLRRNAIIVFMGVELCSTRPTWCSSPSPACTATLDGQVIALFVMVVAAAEVVVGLAIIMAIFRARRSASVDDANLLKLLEGAHRCTTLAHPRPRLTRPATRHRPARVAARRPAAGRRRRPAARRATHQQVGPAAGDRPVLGRFVIGAAGVLPAARGRPPSDARSTSTCSTGSRPAASSSTRACWSTSCRWPSCCWSPSSAR